MYAILVLDVVHFRDQWHFITAYKVVKDNVLLSNGRETRLTTAPLLHKAQARNYSDAGTETETLSFTFRNPRLVGRKLDGIQFARLHSHGVFWPSFS